MPKDPNIVAKDDEYNELTDTNVLVNDILPGSGGSSVWEDSDGDGLYEQPGSGIEVPTGKLEQLRHVPTGVSSNYTTSGESVINVDTSGGAVTVTLASADAVTGNVVEIYDVGESAGTNAITIATEGTETINPGGNSSIKITLNGGFVKLRCQGGNWFTDRNRQSGQVQASAMNAGAIHSAEPNVNYGHPAWLVRTNTLTFKTQFPSLDGVYQGTSGSGSISLNDQAVTISTGTTSGSFARVLVRNPFEPYKWTDKTWYATVSFKDAQGPIYAILGDATQSDKTLPHIGFAMKAGDLIGTVGNGTSETTTTLIAGATTGPRVLRFEFTAGSGVDFHVDGVKEGAISSGLPDSGDNFPGRHYMFLAENSTATDRVIQAGNVHHLQHP